MTFTSASFYIFFVFAFILYWKQTTLLNQNKALLLLGLAFYLIVDYRMILILLLATEAFFSMGSYMENASEKRRNRMVVLGWCIGGGLIAFFKSLNFFIPSVSRFFSICGLHISNPTLDVIMPVGLSYYSFKLISYIIEIDRQRIAPCTSRLEFANYVMFFPTMFSGPIDRPQGFIPQLKTFRKFDCDFAVESMNRFLWGLFKKVVVADGLVHYISEVWGHSERNGCITLISASVFYAIQLYADFSGYSDMAIGVGGLLGFKVTRNFNFPFSATNMAEFWRRWHISLTSWLTDYIFTPLSLRFREFGKCGVLIAVIINMFLVGIWHGLSSSYAAFGLYHGLLFIPLIYCGIGMKRKKQVTSGFIVWMSRIGVFSLFVFGSIIFRSESIEQAVGIVKNIFTMTSGSIFLPKLKYIVFAMMMFVAEYTFMKKYEFPLQFISSRKFFHVTFIMFFVLFILLYGDWGVSQFIYFNF